jgi:glycosyltransferase involved in cell wall biosynthesis
MDIGVAIWQSDNHSDGGVESMTQILERMHRARPVVITQRETPRTERWRKRGLEVHVLPAAYEAWTEDPAGIRHLPRNNAWMASLVRKRNLRVVHMNDLLAFMNLGGGARAAGARLVFNVRDVKPGDQPYRLIWRLAATASDHVIALSQEMARDLEARLRGFFGQPPVSFFYSVVDLERMSVVSSHERTALREKLGLDANRVVLPYVAAFNEKKAQLPFLERTLPALVARNPGALVCFIGDFRPDTDSYARRCAEAVLERGLGNNVRFVGYTPAVADWYGAADAVVLASRNEGLARCMIEAIARGTPVVSFDVCSAREVLEEHSCGIVVRQGDYEGMVEAIERLARAPDLRRTMGVNGARLARELFDPARVVARYEDLYARIGAGARARG